MLTPPVPFFTPFGRFFSRRPERGCISFIVAARHVRRALSHTARLETFILTRNRLKILRSFVRSLPRRAVAGMDVFFVVVFFYFDVGDEIP